MWMIVSHMCTLSHRLNWVLKPFVSRPVQTSGELSRIGWQPWVNVCYTRVLPYSTVTIVWRGLFIILEDIRGWLVEYAVISKWLPEGTCIILYWLSHYIMNCTVFWIELKWLLSMLRCWNCAFILLIGCSFYFFGTSLSVNSTL